MRSTRCSAAWRRSATWLATLPALIAGFLVVEPAAAADEIRVGGGGAAMMTVFQPIKPHFEKATGITLINLQSSPKGGLVNLLEGRVDLSVAAHALDSLIAALAQENVQVNAARLVQQTIGVNRTVVLVHPSNPVRHLSKEQLKGLFTGRTANWRLVGGDERDVLVVWGRGTPGQNADFTRRVLDGESVTKDVLETANYVDIKKTVAATPEAIGIDTVSVTDETVKVVDSDAPLSNPIIAVTLGPPSAKVQRLLDYVRGEGRAHIRQ